MSILSKNLVLLRNEANISIEELSRRTGIKEELLKGFEEETLIPNDYQLEVICKELRVPFDDIKERDILEERRNASKEMKNKKNRENYNWYFGNKKHFIFYLSYIIFFILAVGIISLLIYFKFKDLNIEYLKAEWSKYQYLNYFPIYFVYFVYINTYILYIILGVIVIVFFLIYYFKICERVFYFRWWYLFFIGLFISLLPLIGIFGSIAFFVMCLVIIIRGKY